MRPNEPPRLVLRDCACALAAPVRDALVKKCCEAGGALWNEAGFAAWLAALKLSRPGLIGILPLTRLACRNCDSLMPEGPETPPCPNRSLSMETKPLRTRALLKASFTFEKERSP